MTWASRVRGAASIGVVGAVIGVLGLVPSCSSTTESNSNAAGAMNGAGANSGGASGATNTAGAMNGAGATSAGASGAMNAAGALNGGGASSAGAGGAMNVGGSLNGGAASLGGQSSGVSGAAGACAMPRSFSAGAQACAGDTPILDKGSDTGFSMCSVQGVPGVHRRARVACVDTLTDPPPGSCTEPGCHSDADCKTATPSGRCTAAPAPAYCTCSPVCLSDDDCKPGQLCSCVSQYNGTVSSFGQCLSALCHQDAECGAGFLCATAVVAAADNGCNGTGEVTFACQTSADECFVDADCPHCGITYSKCVLTPAGHRVCSASCQRRTGP